MNTTFGTYTHTNAHTHAPAHTPTHTHTCTRAHAHAPRFFLGDLREYKDKDLVDFNTKYSPIWRTLVEERRKLVRK